MNSTPVAPENASILVIDDEEVMRDVLGTLLAQAGYRVTVAENGAQGLAASRCWKSCASTTPTWWC